MWQTQSNMILNGKLQSLFYKSGKKIIMHTFTICIQNKMLDRAIRQEK
jgi:hypothetical protein